MILNLEKIAQRLNLNVETLERWIRQGRIPVSRKGPMGMFNEAELNKWAARQQKIITSSQAGGPGEKKGTQFVMVSAMQAGGVHHRVPGTDKSEVLEQAAQKVPNLDSAGREALYQQLLDREQLISTGIGQGMAIPHPRNPLAWIKTPMIVTCFLENQVAFAAIDDRPVSLLFLILSPTLAVHLNLLSRLSFCLRDTGFVAFVKTVPGMDELVASARSMEAQIEKKGI